MSASNGHSREGGNLNSLITANLDIWASSIKAKSISGRGSSKNLDLYGIKKLRELILELAVRGKLVPQDPKEESASDLLQKVAKIRDKLLDEGKIKRQKKLPEIDIKEKYFDLPNGWVWTRLIDLYDVRDGTHDTPKYQSCGYPLITSKNLSSGKLDFSNVKYISEEDHLKIIERSKVEIEDVLFAMIGSIGNPVLVDTEQEFSIKNVALFKYYSREISCPSFLLRFLLFAESIFKKEASGAVQSFVSLGTIRSFVIALPPLKEQHRIVAKVDELMALCDQLESQTEASIDAHKTLVEVMLATLTNAKDADELNDSWQHISQHFDALFTTDDSIDQLRQTILQLAVMGKLVKQDPTDEPASVMLERIAAEKEQLIKDKKIKKQKPLPSISDDERPFALPNGWTYTRLDELCATVCSGTTPPKSDLNDTSGIPFLKVYNIQNQKIEFEQRVLFINEEAHQGKLKRSILYPRDVVMNLVGPPLGKVAIIPTTYPEWNCNQNIVCFRPLEIELSKYIYTYIKSHIFLDTIVLVGSAGQDFISGTKCRAIVLPMPPLAEQFSITSKVDELMALCDSLSTRLKETQYTQLHLTDAIADRALL